MLAEIYIGLEKPYRGKMLRILRHGIYLDHENIIHAVCRYFEITEEDIKSRSRKREFVFPRQVAIYLISEHTKLTLKQNGKLFDRDHTTVIYAKETINDLTLTNKEIRAQVLELQGLIKQQ